MSTHNKPNSDRVSLNLLVLQGSPFCNINCDYCYLPDRTITRRMPMTVLEKTFERLLEADLIGPPFELLWHAGEPLAVPVAYYEEAIAAIERILGSTTLVSYVFQTNAMLINQQWCEFFKRHQCEVGVSIDGPAFIHDHHRKTRQGKGTHAQVMEGVAKLQANGISFGVISVISEITLDHPAEMFEFLCQLGASGVGFNIEEIEGANRTTSLAAAGAELRVREFFMRFYELNRQHGFPLRIREFEDARERIEKPGNYRNNEATPFAMINVDCDGNFSTFSPELLGQTSEKYGPFRIGNFLTDSIQDAWKNLRFLQIIEDIESGNRHCAETCRYFSFCQGASPTNKYFENETFDSTETMHCRAVIQAPVDIVRLDLYRHGQWPQTKPVASANGSQIR